MRLVAVFVVLLHAAPAAAWVRTRKLTTDFGDVCAWWPTRDLTFQLNEKGSPDCAFPALVDAVNRSAKAWTDVACSDVTLTYGGTSPRIDASFIEQPTADKPNLNLFVWREKDCDVVVPAEDACRNEDRRDCADVYDCWFYDEATIALTFLNYSKVAGYAVDADMEFNGAPSPTGEWRFSATVAESPKCDEISQTNCVSTDVENTTTHELGHFLGFAHSEVLDATMSTHADLGETWKRTLHADDSEALCTVYPAGGATLLCTASGTLEFTEVSHETGCGSASLPGAAACLLLLARRRRR